MNVTQYGLQDCYKRAFNAIVDAYYQGGRGGVTLEAATAEAQNAVLSQSYLRLEQPIVASNSQIFFPILNNQSGGVSVNARPTEIRLSQQDSFFCSNIAIYIARASSTTDTAFFPQTYPNPVTFPLGGLVSGTGDAPLYNFYNGFMKITINKSVIVPNYPIDNFLQIPQTQLTAATNSPETQLDMSQVALWEPNINFVGTKSSDITINMPAGILTANLDTNTYVIIKIQGILAQNVTLMS
jgi:hypothetical protein